MSLTSFIVGGGLTLGTVGIGGLLSCYKVCRPSQILVKTGLGIKRMEISNSNFVWPFQQCKNTFDCYFILFSILISLNKMYFYRKNQLLMNLY